MCTFVSVDLNNAAVQLGVDRGNTTQAVFPDIINLQVSTRVGGVEIQSRVQY